ncbi:hypothetical protein AGOR_G00041670 [Albula goreensis]|uniref:Microtubule-associated protein 4 n=1 Tax=Albula goreensis TaxID=1534307 RepID=A0A8T3DYH9_9TELE|nr:hypothetical protein AGOR_G00041670 [Albula goreensis]
MTFVPCKFLKAIHSTIAWKAQRKISRRTQDQLRPDRTMDLSLTDALTDGVPQSGPENLVQRDFVAALEAETFDDKVGETVGKTDYRPLLDMDGKREGSGMVPGGQMPAQHQEPQGDMWSFQTEQQVFNTDFLSGPVSMGGFADQWGHQPMVPQTKDSSLTGPFTGFSDPGMMGMMNMDVGVAPLPTARPPSVAEPQQPPSLFATEPPKLAQSPSKPNNQNPFGNPLDFLNAPDTTAGAPGDPWAGEGGLQTDLPFTPSVSTVISRHADEMAEGSPEPSGDTEEYQQQSGGGGEERGNEGGGGGGDKRQKKKKKRRQREEVYDLLESQAENLSPAPPQEPSTDATTAPFADAWSTDTQSQDSPVHETGSSPFCPEDSKAPSGPAFILSPEAPPSPLTNLDRYLASGADEDADDTNMEKDLFPSDLTETLDSLQSQHKMEHDGEAVPMEDSSESSSLHESPTKAAPVHDVLPPSKESPVPQAPPLTEPAVPVPAPSLSPVPNVDMKHSPSPASEEAAAPKDDVMGFASQDIPLAESSAPVSHDSSQMPPISSQTQPLLSSSSPPPAPIPMVSSALNPSAPPFYPSLSDYQEPWSEGRMEDKGPADPSMPEGW